MTTIPLKVCLVKKDSTHATIAPLAFPEAEASAVREQLERIAASASFRSSKRYPEFLRYTVEHALTGEIDSLKERVLGVEVFGRHPDYDTNSDPVVRVSAAEVRKRLDQYYRVRGHEREIRIDYLRGSYVPEFSWPQPHSIPDEVPPRDEVKRETRTTKWRKWTYAGLACFATAATLWAAISYRSNALERFWAPVFDSKATVLLCIPDMSIIVQDNKNARAQNPTSSAFDALQELPLGFQRDEVSFVDAYTVMNVASALTKRGRSFRLFHTEDATLDDLKQGPAVLIGGTNNPWINQVSSTLRFSLAKDGPLDYIADRQNISSRQWGVSWQHPGVDYAIISRIFDSTTGQPIIIAAGVHRMGTEAAGECFSDPACFNQAKKLAPGDWTSANIQIILQTQVVNEVAGQPKVIAAYLSH